MARWAFTENSGELPKSLASGKAAFKSCLGSFQRPSAARIYVPLLITIARDDIAPLADP